MIVVDTNILVHLFVTSERSSHAEAALRRDSNWCAPLLWRSEMLNVMAQQVRVGRMGLDDAMVIAAQATELMRGREYLVTARDTLAIAHECGLTASDSEFVALARDLSVPLVTLDEQIVRACPSTAVSLDAFVV